MCWPLLLPPHLTCFPPSPLLSPLLLNTNRTIDVPGGADRLFQLCGLESQTALNPTGVTVWRSPHCHAWSRPQDRGLILRAQALEAISLPSSGSAAFPCHLLSHHPSSWALCPKPRLKPQRQTLMVPLHRASTLGLCSQAHVRT